MEKFEEAPEGLDIELSGVPVTGTSVGKGEKAATHTFSTGDIVEVCEGELMNLQGRIMSIDGDTVMMLPKHNDLKEEIEFHVKELRKFFTLGDHVKVWINR